MQATTTLTGLLVVRRKVARLASSKTNLPGALPSTYAFKIFPFDPHVTEHSPRHSNSLMRMAVPGGPAGPGGPCSPLSPLAS